MMLVFHQRGQAFIEALLCSFFVAACFLGVIGILAHAHCQLQAQRWAYETLICMEWQQPSFCKSELQRQLQSSFASHIQIRSQQISDRRSIKVQFKIFSQWPLLVEDSVALPLKDL